MAAVTQEFTQELRVAVAGLGIGMFVARLDREWMGSGFPLEGVLLSGDEDVARLRRLCRHVWVDLARGSAPDLRYVVLDGEQAASPARDDPPSPFHPMADAVLGRELGRAARVHDELEVGIREVMEEVRSGGRLDAQKLEEGVDALLDSITRNPSALPWVMEMRRKGDYVYQHGLACSIWAATFGCHLGLERADLRDLTLGALLCDVGKVRLATSALIKPPPLTSSEMAYLRSHVDESCRIVDQTPGLSDAVRGMVASHHERYDGSGYPHGLAGDRIPLFARIAGLIDSYDAMISVRPYAASRSPHQAVMELYDARDRLFQSELVEQFIRTCGIYPTGSLVELSDGSVGVVMSVSSLKRLRPSVMLILDRDKQPLADFRLVDLAETHVDAGGEPLIVRGGLPQGAYGIDRASLFLD